MTAWKRLRRTGTIAGQLCGRLLLIFIPESRAIGIQPSDTARFGIQLGASAGMREHG